MFLNLLICVILRRYLGIIICNYSKARFHDHPSKAIPYSLSWMRPLTG